MNRVGQWKMLPDGYAMCIAQGDGWVMARRKGQEPFVYPTRLWDESFDWTPDPEFTWTVLGNQPGKP